MDLATRDAICAALATLVGLLVRLPGPLTASFPVNDGGLFYQMILDLQAAHFTLPPFTSYNFANIPFAYPPFALYFTGLLAAALNVDLLDVLRVLPAIISSLCVPAFYYLGRRMLETSQATVLAGTLAFALTPRAFEWQIMGGGITRSFGFFFGLLALRAFYSLLKDREARRMPAAIIWGALTLLSHPEATIQIAIATVIVWLCCDRSARGARLALGCGATTLVAAAPWWALVLLRHGAGPFAAAAEAARAGTSVDVPARIFLTFQFKFTDELYLPFIGILGVIGLFSELAARRYMFPLWVTIPLLLEPRSAPQFMVIPLGFLAGLGLMHNVIPSIGRTDHDEPGGPRRLAAAFLVYLFVYLLISAFLTISNLTSALTLRPAERAGLAWISQGTPPGSRFVVITGKNALADPIAEWFPSLTQRESLNTVFGFEWIRRASFATRLEQYDALQACLSRDAACLESWAGATGLEFTDVLIAKGTPPALLLGSLRESRDYELEYENEATAVFRRLP